MLYVTEYWIGKKHVTKMSIAQIRMLRWMCGKVRKDRIRNGNVHDMVGVAPIDDKLRENSFRWFRHICHRPIDVVIRRSDMIV